MHQVNQSGKGFKAVAADAILKVGDGRGFVVECRNYLGRIERIIITAAHCLPKLSSCHPGRYVEEETSARLLGPLGTQPTIWAACLFADPVADIAVLGQPDNQALHEEADAYDQLMADMATLAVADAPAQGFEVVTGFGGRPIKKPTPGKGPARVLSLKGQWLDGQVMRRGGWLEFKPGKFFEGGMSGSPIVNAAGAAIGVVSVDSMSPVIVDGLSASLVRRIRRQGRRSTTA